MVCRASYKDGVVPDCEGADEVPGSVGGGADGDDAGEDMSALLRMYCCSYWLIANR